MKIFNKNVKNKLYWTKVHRSQYSELSKCVYVRDLLILCISLTLRQL